MKRYLIFGFLTILIITLNFAFIIILVTDHVTIDYRVLFLLWGLVILSAGGLAYFERSRRKIQMKSVDPSENTSEKEQFLASKVDERPSLLYKRKLIKKFRINLSQDLTTKVEPGFFAGYIVTEEYANEPVQAVYTNEGQLLGFINKKNQRLCKNLEQLYNEAILCWGDMKWNELERCFSLKAYVPILYSQPEINRLKKLVKLKTGLLNFEKSPDPIDFHTYLEKAEDFYFLQDPDLTEPYLEYSIKAKLLVFWTRKLLEEQKWKELWQLKKFPNVIGNLKKRDKNEIVMAIKLARKKLQKQ